MPNTTKTTKQQAWAIYHTAKGELCKWEHEAGSEYCKKYNEPYGCGLILAGCPHCGKFQTRETYVTGFWAEVIELVTDYSCSGVSRCQCGQWSKWVH